MWDARQCTLFTINDDVVAGLQLDSEWITKSSSQFVPEYSVALVQSNIWPGAVAVATDHGK